MSERTLTDWNVVLLAGFLAGSILLSAPRTWCTQVEEKPAEAVHTFSAPQLSLAARGVSPSSAAVSSSLGTMMYRRLWGVDNMEIREVSSGFMLRFSFRVVDANKAKALNDKKNIPYLIDETTKTKMEVPTMEKIGQLRQTAAPENGREYWMIFSNDGLFVKPGSRVDIVIGNFRVNGLVVESAKPTLSRKSPDE